MGGKQKAIFKLYDPDSKKYISGGGYTKKATWSRRSAAIDVARKELRFFPNLELHEFPIQEPIVAKASDL